MLLKVIVGSDQDACLPFNIFILFFTCSLALCFTAKLVPLAYGIKKLQISCVVEDDKVSTEDLEEKITAFEDYVSCD